VGPTVIALLQILHSSC